MQTRELPVGPIGIIGLNTLSNADGRLNGSAIVVCGHAIHTLDTARYREVNPLHGHEKLSFFSSLSLFISSLLLPSFSPSFVDLERSCYLFLWLSARSFQKIVTRKYTREV